MCRRRLQRVELLQQRLRLHHGGRSGVVSEQVVEAPPRKGDIICAVVDGRLLNNNTDIAPCHAEILRSIWVTAQ
jgi:hypothetical protein